jgi:lipopolysaccharide transport system ATP-binding protein
MKPIIEIKQLGKKYRIEKNDRYLSLREELSNNIRNLFKRKPSKLEDFWALKDINLSIEPGERIGVIGKNGAGKSTLLKVLSRVTVPTRGEAIIRGRLASLLEVGTGFHPELTGKENIYLNGAILGMKKIEIDRQYDAIVDFSGVEKFLSTPLKNYSSGMQMRLAFAVAAHLEPEILLIDEVLAVGDMEFQKKCIGKMEEVSKEHGRTIVFVSHNMSYISSLCSKGILLDKGEIIEQGEIKKTVSGYISSISERSSEISWQNAERPGNETVRLNSLRMINIAGETSSLFKVNEKIGIEMNYEVLKSGHVLWLGQNLYNQNGVTIFDSRNVNHDLYQRPHDSGFYRSIVWIPVNLLNTGIYYVSSAIFNDQEDIIHFYEQEALFFNVTEVFDEETARGQSGGDYPGIIRPFLEWSIEKS